MTDERDPQDPDVDAAWRAHAGDEPPRALDDAIRAAAHRAVGSTPRSAARARGRRNWTAWAPLAVAATLGAIALGVVQLSPHDVDPTRGVVSDAPAGRSAPGSSTVPPPPVASTQVEGVPHPAVTPPEQPKGDSATTGGRKLREQDVDTKQDRGAAARLASPAASRNLAAPSVEDKRQSTAPVPAAPAAPAPPPEPFPAASPQAVPPARAQAEPTDKLEAAKRSDTRDAQFGERRARSESSASATAREPSPAPTLRKDALAQAAPDANARADVAKPAEGAVTRAPSPFPSAPRVISTPAPPASSTPAASAPTPPAPGGPAPAAPAASTPAAPAASGSIGAVGQAPSAPAAERATSSLDAARAKTAPPRSAEDYFATLRRLRDEGREAEAIAMLAAYRATFGDDDQKLPGDLRLWAMRVTRP